jgi:hypothetical protein
MKNAVFGYSTPNLGDDVQALAAAMLFPNVDSYVNRDMLDRVSLATQHKIIMNSWFAVKRYKATPSQSLSPIFFGQCIGRPELVNEEWLKVWKAHEPIGCRDLNTVDTLGANGIQAYYSGCLTTWMGRFINPPARREGVIFVDVPQAMERYIPEDIRARARRITNDTAKGVTNQKERFFKAAKVLDEVRCAKMVVTRRLHTALPCVGFGTPVTVYLENKERNLQRFSGADRFLPIILHRNDAPLEGEGWINPTAVMPTSEMEAGFSTLLAKLNAQQLPRWQSVEEFVHSLPDAPVEPQGLLNRLLRFW